MIVLSVNLNKVALIRNARAGDQPSLPEMAKLCVQSGAGGITLHPRPDMRHARPDDVHLLSGMLTEGVLPGAEFNLEGNPFSMASGDYPGFMQIARSAPVHQCTLVPDTPDQLTSDSGWELDGDMAALAEVIAELKSLGRRVSLFIDPEVRYVEPAARLGADRVELFTGPWAAAYNYAWQSVDEFAHQKALAVLEKYQDAALDAVNCGLAVNAGHDLSLDNLRGICQLPGLREVSIGHSLVTEALRVGFPAAIKRYQQELMSSLARQQALGLPN